MLGAAVLPALAAAAAPWAGPYAVAEGVIADVPGLAAQKPHAADVVYATGAGNATFPLLVFGHGYGSGGAKIAPHYKTLLHQVASYGFVVVAPQSCPTQLCMVNYYKDMLATIDACKANRTLHPALAAASFSRVGVFGHSQGGVATVDAAAQDGHGIAAAVAHHPCSANGAKVRVPTMFITGSKDTTCAPGQADKQFAASPVDGKVLFNIEGANHEEPTDDGCSGKACPNREDVPAALFFACRLRGEQCDAVASICTQDFKLAECKVQ